MPDRPPFLKGQDAYRAGEPLEANPHSEVIHQGDAYPGPWACWRQGWLNEKWTAEHDAALKERRA